MCNWHFWLLSTRSERNEFNLKFWYIATRIVFVIRGTELSLDLLKSSDECFLILVNVCRPTSCFDMSIRNETLMHISRATSIFFRRVLVEWAYCLAFWWISWRKLLEIV